jgi:hypothetical protein
MPKEILETLEHIGIALAILAVLLLVATGGMKK